MILEGVELLLIPRVNSAVEKYRLGLWKSNGAIVRDMKWLNRQKAHVDGLFIVANDLAGDARRNEAIERFGGRGDIYTIVKSQWLSDSLEKGKLRPYEEYLYEERPPSKKRKKADSKDLKDDEGSEQSSGLLKQPTDLSKKSKKVRGIIASLTRLRDHKKVSKEEEELLTTNKRIVDIFQKMVDLLEVSKLEDSTAEFRMMKYQNVLRTVQTVSEPIESSGDLAGYYGIGKSMLGHIDEIIRTGTFEKYEQLKRKVAANKSLGVVQEICQVHGFGPVTAYKLVKGGKVHSMTDLEEPTMYSTLTWQQKIGLQYREDWLERIPHHLVTEYFDRLLDIVSKKPLCAENQPVLRIMGSYLRQSPDCGDIDILMYQRDESDLSQLSKLLYRLVRLLEEAKFIQCELTDVNEKMTKFNGGCALADGKSRRIDIIVVPYSELGSSLIYFAGNDTFNRGCRMLAGLNGWHLSNKGLFKKDSSGPLIESSDETKILDLLGVGWVDYSDRNV